MGQVKCERLASVNASNGYYNLWSTSINLLDAIQQQHESNDEPSSTKTAHNSPLSKRKDSECSSSSALSSSPTSSIDYSSCNEYTSHSSLQNQNNHHHKRNGQNLPSTKAAYAANNGYGLDFLAAVIRQTSKLNTCCSFCKNNGESEKIYTSHTMKNSKGKVTCPLLKLYKCPICGQTGDSAHTITYCKKYKLLKRENMLHELKM